MYAIVKDGGRQFTVREGDRILVDRKDGVSNGDEVRFDQVLLVGGDSGTKVGTPTVDGATVVGKVVGADEKGRKLVVFKKRKRKDSKKKQGHRQRFTAVSIEKIEA